MKSIKMSNIINAETQHEIDAVETAQKWREWCKKVREEKMKD